jgi:hypothetical protein
MRLHPVDSVSMPEVRPFMRLHPVDSVSMPEVRPFVGNSVFRSIATAYLDVMVEPRSPIFFSKSFQ